MFSPNELPHFVKTFSIGSEKSFFVLKTSKIDIFEKYAPILANPLFSGIRANLVKIILTFCQKVTKNVGFRQNFCDK